MRRALSVVVLVVTACSSLEGTPPPSATSVTTTTTDQAGTTTTMAPTTSTSLTTTTTSLGDLDGEVIVLDPGHNGMNWAHPEEINREVDIGTGTKTCNTTGTSTTNGYAEALFSWEVALRARDHLENLGATVVLTREDNEGWGPCITDRAAIGNRVGAGAVISIHADGGPSGGRGFHVIYPQEVEGFTDDIALDSERLAWMLHDRYLSTGMPIADYIGVDGYTQRDDLGGLTLSDVPVVFLEAGNMRNPVDADLLTDPGFQDQIAEAIVRALVAFFNG